MNRRQFFGCLAAIPFVAKMLSVIAPTSTPRPALAELKADAMRKAIENAVGAITSQQLFIIDSFRDQIYLADELDLQDTPLYDTETYVFGEETA